MAKGISLIIMKAGASTGTDITGLVESVTWSGRRGSPTRTCQISLIDDDGYKHARSGIDIEEGYQCIFSYDGSELFRGIFLQQNQTHSKTSTYKAYDLGIYLSNNKDTFCYENKTASDVFKDVCSRFGIPTGDVASTSYSIPDLTKKKTTGWDAIADALSLEYENAGAKYYVFSDKGKLHLRKRLENVLQWVLDVNTNITNYKYTKNIESVKTRIKLLSKEGTSLAQEQDTALEKKYGIFQDVDTPDESLSNAQIKSLAKTLLEEKKTPLRTLTLSNTLGIADVISGVGVLIKIPHLGINKTFYVDSDTHIFKGNLHTMSLELNLVSEASPPDEPPKQETAPSTSHNVGDVVNFHGGKHYVASTASSPASTNLGAGPAKITLTNKGSAHPWHLVTEDWGKTHVWGWVDDGTFD